MLASLLVRELMTTWSIASIAGNPRGVSYLNRGRLAGDATRRESGSDGGIRINSGDRVRLVVVDEI